MERILIKNGRLFDRNKLVCKDIFTYNGVISKIEPNITDKADFVFDASGMIVSPGLVDTHVHIKGLSSDDFGINAEMSCLPFGVTAAADAGSSYGDRAFLDSIAVNLLGEICTAEDIVNLVEFLTSDKANFITGQTYVCDGGRTLSMKGTD